MHRRNDGKSTQLLTRPPIFPLFLASCPGMRCFADKGRKRGKTRGGKRRKEVVKLSRAELVG